MTHRLANNYAKNYCNRTLIVKVIAENVVTCFLGTQCSQTYCNVFICTCPFCLVQLRIVNLVNKWMCCYLLTNTHSKIDVTRGRAMPSRYPAFLVRCIAQQSVMTY